MRRAPQPTTLYGKLAARLAGAIESGALRPGDRLPSIRALRDQERASVATVTQALARLESLGLVDARPRSGYYVRPPSAAAMPLPVRTQPRAKPTAVAVTSLFAQVYAAARDPRVVPLGAAIPSPALFPTRALARAESAAARASPEGTAIYQVPPGFAPLRAAIARRLLSCGCALGPDDLVVTGGASEAIHLALLAVAARGDVVAVESPAFHGTLHVIEALGLRALEVPCDAATGLCLDELERRIERQRVAAVVAVPNFSNPLGSRMPDAAKRRLVRTLAARQIPLVEDDVYGDLSFAGDRPKLAKAFDVDGGVLLCGSFSKSLAPGMRIGWIAAGRFRDRVEQLKAALNVASPTIPQHALARYLAEGAYDRHLRQLRPKLASIVAQTAAAIAGSFPAGTRVSRPQGGCVLWVEMPPSVDALELHVRALEAGVGIAPGPLFSPTQGFRSCIRLSCAHPFDERIRAGVETVGRIATLLAEGGGGALARG